MDASVNTVERKKLYLPGEVLWLGLQVGGDVLPLPTAHLILYEKRCNNGIGNQQNMNYKKNK